MKLICNRTKECMFDYCEHHVPHKHIYGDIDCEIEITCCISQLDAKCVPYIKKKKKIPGVTMMVCKEAKNCKNDLCDHIKHPTFIPFRKYLGHARGLYVALLVIM